MDQLLDKIFRYIPEWMFVVIILIGGIVFFFYDSPLLSVCGAQKNEFFKGQTGKLIPGVVSFIDPLTGSNASRFMKAELQESRKACIQSLRGTGCRKYFEIINLMFSDYKKLSHQCLLELGQENVMRQVLGQYIMTMTRLAWGDDPPTTSFEKQAWLSALELKSFCQARSYYRIFYPPENWDSLVGATLSQVVEDPNKLKKSEPTGIKDKFDEEQERLKKKEYSFPKAKMSFKKAYDLSLLSFECLQYQ